MASHEISWLDYFFHGIHIQCEREVLEHSKQLGHDAGTTAVCLVVVDGCVYTANTGDSRCVLVRRKPSSSSSSASSSSTLTPTVTSSSSALSKNRTPSAAGQIAGNVAGSLGGFAAASVGGVISPLDVALIGAAHQSTHWLTSPSTGLPITFADAPDRVGLYGAMRPSSPLSLLSAFGVPVPAPPVALARGAPPPPPAVPQPPSVVPVTNNNNHSSHSNNGSRRKVSVPAPANLTPPDSKLTDAAKLCKELGVETVDLSIDHKPARADERARIERLGGAVRVPYDLI